MQIFAAILMIIVSVPLVLAIWGAAVIFNRRCEVTLTQRQIGLYALVTTGTFWIGCVLGAVIADIVLSRYLEGEGFAAVMLVTGLASASLAGGFYWRSVAKRQ